MTRLVVVSNRVPVPGDRSPAAGGLAIGLADAVTAGSVWFGWSGPARTHHLNRGKRWVKHRDISYATIDLAEADYRHFYVGFSNGVLWPLLSYRLGQVNFRRNDYAGYRVVNEAFATALAPLLQSDDLVWIHDYQLLAVGHALRKLGAEQRIGFFLHTPFPPPAIFCALPRAAELLEALCACDLVGFHTADYRDAFLQCVSVLLDAPTDSEGTFTFRGRRVRAIVDPIGIDVGGFAATAARSVGNATAQRLANSLGGRPLAVSADRLDYAKGLPNRVQALDHLFARHPEHRNHLIFLQIAAPSREELAVYRALRRELDRTVGDINGRYSEADWTPVRYLTRTVRTHDAGRLLSPRPSGRCDAAARRNESGSQGIHRCPECRRPRCADPVAFCRRGRGPGRCLDRQPVRFGRDCRSHASGTGDAVGRTPGPS